MRLKTEVPRIDLVDRDIGKRHVLGFNTMSCWAFEGIGT